MQFKLDKTVLKNKLKSIKTKDKAIFHSYLVDLLNVSEKMKVLDLGCGHGNTLMYLSKKISNQGKIIGVDRDPELLGVAEHLFKTDILNKKVELVKFDLDDKLPFKENTFDRIVCHNVLECIEDKIKFINECYVLLKKDGILVMSHSDWDSQIYNSSYNDISRKLIHNYSDTTQDWMKNSDGTIGRKLNGIFHKTKFKKIDPRVYTTVDYNFKEDDYSFRIAQDIMNVAKRNKHISSKEIDIWLNDLKEKNKSKEFYYSYLTNIIIAKK